MTALVSAVHQINLCNLSYKIRQNKTEIFHQRLLTLRENAKVSKKRYNKVDKNVKIRRIEVFIEVKKKK